VGRLAYSTTTSLDGFINDEHGNFDWSTPSDEVHAFVNDALRPLRTHLYGRRSYEVMRVWETLNDVTGAWETLGGEPGHSEYLEDFARIWQAVDKVVYSRTLSPDDVTTARTRLERAFDPDAVREMKATSERDLLVGGAGLAAEAFAAGLVDDVHLYLAPVIVGGGTRALPEGVRADLELVEERRFDNGTVYVRYRVT
jgi:dihydrofolate reductase